jgi:RimJ/RimL family protein N-acetyltransferase
MSAQTFAGQLVRLALIDAEQDSACWARWSQDSEYQQLQSSGPSSLWPAKQIKEWTEKHFDEFFMLSIHTLAYDRIIGNTELSEIDWVAGNAWVGIGIGEREYWGKGYGSDALNVLLRFAFEYLNLKRISLNVFEYNERAIKSYLKVGFKEEGRMRQWMQRSGQRYDLIFMGILRGEWEERQQAIPAAQHKPRLENEELRKD